MSVIKHQPTKIIPDSLLKRPDSFDEALFAEHVANFEKRLQNILGSAYYADDGFMIYHASCHDILDALEGHDIFFDLTSTSPPYNIGKDYESVMPIGDYVDWCESWMNKIYRNSGEKSSFWLNVGHFEVPDQGKCVPIPYLIWDKTDFYLMQEVVWHYGAGVQTKLRLSPRNEKWLYYVMDQSNYTFNLDDIRDPNVKYPNQKKNGKLRVNPLGKNPSDVWEIPKVTTGSKRSSRESVDHPAQFPLRVVERTIRASSNIYDLVFDPFSGSGTTGIAANCLGRLFLGVETNKDYCDISVERYLKQKQYRGEFNAQQNLL